MDASLIDSGLVRLRLRWQDGGRCLAALEVARPTAVAAMRGKPADQAVRLLPLLYSICGAAQGIAANLALRAARGEPQAPAADAGVLAEARREHLFRLLLDWPRVLGLPTHEALLAEGVRRLRQADFADWQAVALREVLAGLEQALAALPELSPAATRLLPPLTAAESLSLWPRLDAGFAATPGYLGQPAETGALARHPELAAAPAALARVRARIADLARPGGLGQTSAATVAPGIGRALVETARGLLMHEIALDGERVAEYVIVAPTEWNFHPGGGLCSWLEGVPATTAAEAKALAERAVLALDPCVRWEIALDAGV